MAKGSSSPVLPHAAVSTVTKLLPGSQTTCRRGTTSHHGGYCSGHVDGMPNHPLPRTESHETDSPSRRHSLGDGLESQIRQAYCTNPHPTDTLASQTPAARLYTSPTYRDPCSSSADKPFAKRAN